MAPKKGKAKQPEPEPAPATAAPVPEEASNERYVAGASEWK